MGDTAVKHQSRRDARAAWNKATTEWSKEVQDLAHAHTDAWRAAVTAQSVGFEPLVAKLLDLHKPYVQDPDFREPGSITCSECFNHDDAYYERRSAAWPCKTVLLTAEGLDLPAHPDIPPEPVYEDFWDEPMVTVRFAHLTIDNRFHSGQDVTMKLTDAVRYKGALDTRSREQVMDLDR